MIKNSKIAVVIPVYNEEETLPTLFYRIDGVYKMLKDDYSVKFIFINDGSRDRSDQLLKEKYGTDPWVQLVNHPGNVGYGATQKTGFKLALEQGFDYILTIDADTNYDQFMLPHFIYEFNPQQEDILASSPWHPQCSRKNFPLVRYLLSYSMSLIYQWALSPQCPPLTCYSACLRVYKREVLETITFESDNFLANTEIMTKALLAGYRVRELPINVNYRQFGMSKMKISKTISHHLKYLGYLFTIHKLKGSRNYVRNLRNLLF